MDYWHTQITESTARRILGGEHFDYAVARGAAYCESRRAGSWDANLGESFAAYDCAARVAQQQQAVRA